MLQPGANVYRHTLATGLFQCHINIWLANSLQGIPLFYPFYTHFPETFASELFSSCQAMLPTGLSISLKNN